MFTHSLRTLTAHTVPISSRAVPASTWRCMASLTKGDLACWPPRVESASTCRAVASQSLRVGQNTAQQRGRLADYTAHPEREHTIVPSVGFLLAYLAMLWYTCDVKQRVMTPLQCARWSSVPTLYFNPRLKRKTLFFSLPQGTMCVASGTGRYSGPKVTTLVGVHSSQRPTSAMLGSVADSALGGTQCECQVQCRTVVRAQQPTGCACEGGSRHQLEVGVMQTSVL